MLLVTSSPSVRRTTPLHAKVVVQSMFDNERGKLWRAHCPCGWSDQWSDNPALALPAARAHRDELAEPTAS